MKNNNYLFQSDSYLPLKMKMQVQICKLEETYLEMRKKVLEDCISSDETKKAWQDGALFDAVNVINNAMALYEKDNDEPFDIWTNLR